MVYYLQVNSNTAISKERRLWYLYGKNSARIIVYWYNNTMVQQYNGANAHQYNGKKVQRQEGQRQKTNVLRGTNGLSAVILSL